MSLVSPQNVRTILLNHLTSAVCVPIDKYVYNEIDGAQKEERNKRRNERRKKERDRGKERGREREDERKHLALVKRVLLRILTSSERLEKLERAILYASPKTNKMLNNLLRMYERDIRECDATFTSKIHVTLGECIRQLLVRLSENAHMYAASSGTTYADTLDLMRQTIKQTILDSISVESALSLSSSLLQSPGSAPSSIEKVAIKTETSDLEIQKTTDSETEVAATSSANELDDIVQGDAPKSRREPVKRETFERMIQGRSRMQSPPPSPYLSYNNSRLDAKTHRKADDESNSMSVSSSGSDGAPGTAHRAREMVERERPKYGKRIKRRDERKHVHAKGRLPPLTPPSTPPLPLHSSSHASPTASNASSLRTNLFWNRERRRDNRKIERKRDRYVDESGSSHSSSQLTMDNLKEHTQRTQEEENEPLHPFQTLSPKSERRQLMLESAEDIDTDQSSSNLSEDSLIMD